MKDEQPCLSCGKNTFKIAYWNVCNRHGCGFQWMTDYYEGILYYRSGSGDKKIAPSECLLVVKDEPL
jgi:hypothetical protein